MYPCTESLNWSVQGNLETGRTAIPCNGKWTFFAWYVSYTAPTEDDYKHMHTTTQSPYLAVQRQMFLSNFFIFCALVHCGCYALSQHCTVHWRQQKYLLMLQAHFFRSFWTELASLRMNGRFNIPPLPFHVACMQCVAYRQCLDVHIVQIVGYCICLLYTSPSPRDRTRSRMPSSA